MAEHMDVTMDTRRAHEYFLNELCYSIGPKGLKEKIKNDVNSFNLIDVRGYDDYIDGHIPFAMHVPYDELEEHFNMFSKEKVNIIYSYSIVCQLAKKCAVKLTEKGYPVMELIGGFKAWKKHDFDIVKDSADMG